MDEQNKEDAGLREPVTVITRYPDGRVSSNPERYMVNLSPCGVLVEIQHADGPLEGRGMQIHRFAWDGIVAAVAEVMARDAELAKQHNAASRLLYGDDDD